MKTDKTPIKKVALYAGCLIDFVYPDLGEDIIEVLNHFGVEVVFPEGQTCCGAPAKYSGAKSSAIKLAQQNVEALDNPEYDAIVSACPTCIIVVRDDFLKLLGDDPKYSEGAKRIHEKTRDFTDLVMELAGEEKWAELMEGPKVTYHDSCHYNRSLGLKGVARKALTELAGSELIEMEGSDLCCGMGGSYTVKFPELSAPILARKLSSVEQSGADVVAMDCPGCLMQIGGGLDKQNSKVVAKHTATILAEALRKRKS
ncbi:MAG: (Fe-S)-binding protein [Bacillota bacterium]